MAHEHDMFMLLTDAAVELRDAAALGQYALQLEELATRDDHRLYQAIAQRGLGVAQRLEGYPPASEERLNRAMELFVELDARWQIGRTLCELAETKLSRSDPTGARHCYLRALKLFELMQAKPDIERTQTALEAIG